MTEDKKSDEIEIEIDDGVVELSKDNAKDNSLDLEIEIEIMDAQEASGNDTIEQTIEINDDLENDLDIAVGSDKKGDMDIKASKSDYSSSDDFDDIELEAELSNVSQAKKTGSSKSWFIAALVLLTIGGGANYAYNDPEVQKYVKSMSGDDMPTADIVLNNDVAESSVGMDIDFPAPEIVFNKDVNINEEIAMIDSLSGDLLDIPEVSDSDLIGVKEENITEQNETVLGNQVSEMPSASDVSIYENIEISPVEETGNISESFAQEEIVGEPPSMEQHVEEMYSSDIDEPKDTMPEEISSKEEFFEEEDFSDYTDQGAGTFSTDEIPEVPNDGFVQKDVYYDAPPVIDGVQIQNTGPRKVNPSIERGSRIILIQKEKNAGLTDAKIVAAKRAMKIGRYDAAADMYEGLYEKNKRDERILMGLAVAYQKMGKTEKAVIIYEELYDINPDNSNAMINMLGLLREDQPAIALKKLLELKKKYPENAGVYAQIGITSGALKNYKEALKYLAIASSIEPKNAQHIFNMAIISERMKKTKTAIRYYEQALEVDALYGSSRTVNRKLAYDRLSKLRRKL